MKYNCCYYSQKLRTGCKTAVEKRIADEISRKMIKRNLCETNEEMREPTDDDHRTSDNSPNRSPVLSTDENVLNYHQSDDNHAENSVSILLNTCLSID